MLLIMHRFDLQLYLFIMRDIEENSSSVIQQSSKKVQFQPVPVYRVSLIRQPVIMESKRASGELYGILEKSLHNSQKFIGNYDFIGNFEGYFTSSEPDDGNIFTFQGHIRIYSVFTTKIGQQNEQKKTYIDFKGYFKGRMALDQKIEMHHTLQYKDTFQEHQAKKENTSKPEFYCPTLVTFEIERINAISLSELSASVEAKLSVQIQFCDTIMEQYDKLSKKERRKKLCLQFNHDTPLDIIIKLEQQNQDENEEQDQGTDDDEGYEWDDIWQGIIIKQNYDSKSKRLFLSVKKEYRVSIDNSYGLFFAPFNLNVLKLVLNIHSFKINHIKVVPIPCELQDFNKIKNNKIRQYTPYANFDALQVYDDQKQEKVSQSKYFQKHIDRLTKINAEKYKDMGQFRLADNRLYLFPYFKRVVGIEANPAKRGVSWKCSWKGRSEQIQHPIPFSIQEGYEMAKKAKQEKEDATVRRFTKELWEYVHIQIPLYKYPVIDILRIFMPLVVLSIISLLIFKQENGYNNSDQTLFAKRIASCCSLMIAYIALIPTIRSSIPPSPTITLVEILIYASVIPNILAIISVLTVGEIKYSEFFATYTPFKDPLFLISFVLAVIAVLGILVSTAIVAMKTYKRKFKISKFTPSSFDRLTSPDYLSYMKKLAQARPEYQVQAINWWNEINVKQIKSQKESFQ